MYRKYLIAIMILLFAVPMVTAQDQSELKIEVLINSDHGWPTRIIVSGTCHLEKAWLGMSMYPYGVLDYITGGRHSFIELKKGDFRHEIQVDANLLGGSFEFAIWGKKVDKVDCNKDYCYWCKMNGYHVEDLLSYKSGLLSRQIGYE